jgi:uncharacterized protein (TIGR00369 family)
LGESADRREHLQKNQRLKVCDLQALQHGGDDGANAKFASNVTHYSCQFMPILFQGIDLLFHHRHGETAQTLEDEPMTANKVFEEISPNFKAALIKKAPVAHPFWALLGMTLIDIKKGWAVVKLPFDRKLTQADGIAHGGSIFATADAAVGMALIGCIERTETMVTLEMKINYLKPFARGAILAQAEIVQKGARTALGEVRVITESGDLIAKALATYMIFSKPEP